MKDHKDKSMAMFSLPSDLEPDEMTKNYAAMPDWMSADGDNLMPFVTQSTGAAVIATSLGLSMASHISGAMLGMFEGMMSVSMKAAHRGTDNLAAPISRANTEMVADHFTTSAGASNVVSLNSGKKAKKAKSTVAKADKAEKLAPEIEARANEAPVAAAVEPSRPMSVLQPEDFRRPAEIEKPNPADDLKLISGVGPKLEQVLNSLGIWTFAQVSKWTPNEIAWMDDYLQFKGRIERDNWMAQSAALAEGGLKEQARGLGGEPR